MNAFDRAFLTRLIVTIITLVCVRRYTKAPGYIIIALLVGVLDQLDSLYLMRTPGYGYETRACDTYNYILRDKVADSISYALAFALFEIEPSYMLFVMWRFVGVLLYGITKQVRWIIICPDMAKEYLVYSSIYNGDMSWFSIIVGFKIVYEVLHHIILQPVLETTYSNSSSQSPPVSKITGTIASLHQLNKKPKPELSLE